MNTEKAQQPAKPKLPPTYVRECLSRDVNAILSVCIHQFKEGDEMETECFNVDAVIAGRSLRPKVRFERTIAPANWATARTPIADNRPYTASGKGSFIPEGHFSPRFA